MYKNYRDARADEYKIKLIYFNGRGRAEHIRLILAAGGRKYEDCRIAGEEWGTLKPKTPFGSLPVMEADGQMIGGGPAIGRFVAKLCELDGDNYLEQALGDAVVDIALEIRENLLEALVAAQKDKDNMPKLVEAAMEKVKPKLEKLEALAKGKNFFCGDKATHADIQFYAVCEIPFIMMKMDNFLEAYPCLKALNGRVGELKNIKEYVKNRAATDF